MKQGRLHPLLVLLNFWVGEFFKSNASGMIRDFIV